MKKGELIGAIVVILVLYPLLPLGYIVGKILEKKEEYNIKAWRNSK